MRNDVLGYRNHLRSPKTSKKKDGYANSLEWYEPNEDANGTVRVVEKEPGKNYFHAVSEKEVGARLQSLSATFLKGLQVVELSTMARKRQNSNIIGTQWGSTIYLFPVHESCVDEIIQPPPPQYVQEIQKYGARLREREGGKCNIHWTREQLRDYYLNNVFMHELGHIHDDRNKSYVDRERYANWFADHYGYPLSEAYRQRMQHAVHRKRHDAQ
jgi:hypothetical protein